MNLNDKVSTVRHEYASRVAKAEYIKGEIKRGKQELENLTQHLEDLEKARWVIVEVAQLCQKKCQDYIERMVTMAIRSVFEDNDYKFLLKFDVKGNKSTCQPLVQEGNEEPEIPKDEGGVGIIDVISFSWRVVMWSLQKPRTRAFFYLDEPMRHTGSLLLKAGAMMRKIASSLSIQLLIVTHDQDLSAIADRAWDTRRRGGVSTVKLITGEEPKVRRRIVL